MFILRLALCRSAVRGHRAPLSTAPHRVNDRLPGSNDDPFLAGEGLWWQGEQPRPLLLEARADAAIPVLRTRAFGRFALAPGECLGVAFLRSRSQYSGIFQPSCCAHLTLVAPQFIGGKVGSRMSEIRTYGSIRAPGENHRGRPDRASMQR
jgi:hypothetical protein